MFYGSNLKIVIILTLIIIFILIWFVLTLRSIYFKKRINNYVISSNVSDDISILGKLEKLYLRIRNKMVKVLKKKIKSKNKIQEEIEEDLIFICEKIIVSIFMLLIYLIISFITFTKPIFLLIIFFLLLGFILPIIKQKIVYIINRKKIEKDLLKAISLINSSLQSGKSMMQAIKTVAKELDGPLASEFQKIAKDIEKGLSLSIAFTRFEKRVNLDEVDYITTSLLILNQTGGNIVSMFKSLEESFYVRRNLNNELKATIASSKLVFQLLLFLPFFIYLLIGLWNPTYFTIFFKSSLGVMLFLIIILIYILYIIIIKNIMKVEKY